MVDARISDATPADVLALAADLSAADAAELRAAGLTVEACLSGIPAQVLHVDGRAAALFGVQSHPTSPGGGIPWMLSANALALVPRCRVAQLSAEVVAGWREQFDNLTNLVHRRNTQALRFVRWLGFTVGDLPCGPGQEFFFFEWRRDV